MKKGYLLIFCIFLYINSISNLQAQQSRDFNRFDSFELQSIKSRGGAKPFKKYIQNNKNEFQFSVSCLFWFYKEFISSQDVARCSFIPSCSVYAVKSIKKKGILGILDACDRLTRCNPYSPENYILDKHTHLLIDSISDY